LRTEHELQIPQRPRPIARHHSSGEGCHAACPLPSQREVAAFEPDSKRPETNPFRVMPDLPDAPACRSSSMRAHGTVNRLHATYQTVLAGKIRLRNAAGWAYKPIGAE
jgi:hypothetical protein